MSISIDSRLWLATHLMYPNSSQAFDIYQSLIGQSEELLKKNKISFIFQKLSQIVDKIPAVSSNKAFHVFENQQIEQWQMIYKKSKKEQMVIFVGVFIFEMNVKDIANSLKITFEKAQFLFHQTFKKSVFMNIKTDVAEKIIFKKYNEEKVSFLFTNENLIDYCLKNLPAAEMKKVKIGLQFYPELQSSEKQYSLIVQSMHVLLEDQKSRVTKPLIQTSETLSTPRQEINFLTLVGQHKKLITSVSLSMVCIAIVLIRPQWVQQITERSKDRFVVLQEVKPKQDHLDELQPDKALLSLNEMPVKTDSKDKNGAQVAVVAKNEKVDPTKPAPKDKVADSKPTSVAAAVPIAKHVPPVETSNAAQAKKVGGLYRGVLIVTDINEVTPKITQKIVDIGAKKAGEVELGWRKSEKLSYFHFTLPENNIDAMKEFISKFGSLQIQFENHPRLMPAGVKRLIIEVKERE
jgi:hypothetical protein